MIQQSITTTKVVQTRAGDLVRTEIEVTEVVTTHVPEEVVQPNVEIEIVLSGGDEGEPAVLGQAEPDEVDVEAIRKAMRDAPFATKDRRHFRDGRRFSVDD